MGGQGSPDSTGKADPGTKAGCPESLIHDAGTRDAKGILEESP